MEKIPFASTDFCPPCAEDTRGCCDFLSLFQGAREHPEQCPGTSQDQPGHQPARLRLHWRVVAPQATASLSAQAIATTWRAQPTRSTLTLANLVLCLVVLSATSAKFRALAIRLPWTLLFLCRPHRGPPLVRHAPNSTNHVQSPSGCFLLFVPHKILPLSFRAPCSPRVTRAQR